MFTEAIRLLTRKDKESKQPKLITLLAGTGGGISFSTDFKVNPDQEGNPSFEQVIFIEGNMATVKGKKTSTHEFKYTTTSREVLSTREWLDSTRSERLKTSDFELNVADILLGHIENRVFGQFTPLIH